MKNKIFLGGTCADTDWRDKLIKILEIDYFNPVVKDWTPECQANEMHEKEFLCNIHFYLISKEMKGVFSIAELMDSVHTKGKRTIVHIVPDGFDVAQIKSLEAVADLVNLRGGIAYVDSELSRSVRVLQSCFY